MNSTRNYDMFVFRDDNRSSIDKYHLKRVIESIQKNNLLQFRPIVVNKNMEVLDGQHRLLAAKSLNLEIYYQIQESFDVKDIVSMNLTKSWTNGDYLNFYVKNNYPEYIKLNDFTNKNNLPVRVALNLFFGRNTAASKNFKEGGFIFDEMYVKGNLELCWRTIDIIKKSNGNNSYTTGCKFWSAMLTLFNHDDFNDDQWIRHLEKYAYKISPRVNKKEYLKVICYVYNFKMTNKITFSETLD